MTEPADGSPFKRRWLVGYAVLATFGWIVVLTILVRWVILL